MSRMTPEQFQQMVQKHLGDAGRFSGYHSEIKKAMGKLGISPYRSMSKHQAIKHLESLGKEMEGTRFEMKSGGTVKERVERFMKEEALAALPKGPAEEELLHAKRRKEALKRLHQRERAVEIETEGQQKFSQNDKTVGSISQVTMQNQEEKNAKTTEQNIPDMDIG